jgi:lysophospholipase
MSLQVGWHQPEPGVHLRWAVQHPPGPPRGVLVLLQGRTEFIEKYSEVIERLAARGLQVWTFDLRGQGLSTRPLANPHKGHVEDFDDYQRDLRSFLDEVVWGSPALAPGPRLLLAHSLGGLIALRYLLERPADFDRAVLSAPMLGVPTPLPPWLTEQLAALLVHLGLGEAYVARGDYGERNRTFTDNPWTSDPARLAQTVARVSADPRLALGGITVRWLWASLREMRALCAPGRLSRLQVPTLVVAAGQDRCVRTEDTLAAFAGVGAVELKRLDGAQHELMFEQDRHRDRFLALLEGFLFGEGA